MASPALSFSERVLHLINHEMWLLIQRMIAGLLRHRRAIRRRANRVTVRSCGTKKPHARDEHRLVSSRDRMAGGEVDAEPHARITEAGRQIGRSQAVVAQRAGAKREP